MLLLLRSVAQGLRCCGLLCFVCPFFSSFLVAPRLRLVAAALLLLLLLCLCAAAAAAALVLLVCCVVWCCLVCGDKGQELGLCSRAVVNQSVGHKTLPKQIRMVWCRATRPDLFVCPKAPLPQKYSAISQFWEYTNKLPKPTSSTRLKPRSAPLTDPPRRAPARPTRAAQAPAAPAPCTLPAALVPGTAARLCSVFASLPLLLP